jgi:hypothetical protein
MKLDENVNYIVSGLERSGTSLLMQMLDAGGVPSAFDHSSRPADDNNPRGYFELEGGKIINKLMEGTFPFEEHKGRFVKITAYGMKFLPQGNYKIIYSLRDIEEILDSMEKMSKIKDENRADTRELFLRLNEMMIDKIKTRTDIQALFINYNEILADPETNAQIICDFIGESDIDKEKMTGSIDRKLYRNRRD